jgi:hypothetical protein
MSIPVLLRTALTGVFVLSLTLVLHGSASGGASPAVALQGPSGPVPGNTFEVTVVGADLPALGAYEVVVGFDELHLEFVAGADAGFLGSTGRNIFCPTAVVAAGEARFGCASTGQGPGPGGDATLATLYFKALEPGLTDVALKDAGLADEFGNNAGAAALRGASITVEGASTPRPTSTPTPAPKTEPTPEQTAQFVPPVDTPTAGSGAPTRTAIPTATNTRAPNPSTPAANQGTSTPAFGVIPGTDGGPAASNEVLGASRPAVGITLPETGSGGSSTTHLSWLQLGFPVALVLAAVAIPLVARRR